MSLNISTKGTENLNGTSMKSVPVKSPVLNETVAQIEKAIIEGRRFGSWTI